MRKGITFEGKEEGLKKGAGADPGIMKVHAVHIMKGGGLACSVDYNKESTIFYTFTPCVGSFAFKA